jgi:hypothetical protein
VMAACAAEAALLASMPHDLVVCVPEEIWDEFRRQMETAIRVAATASCQHDHDTPWPEAHNEGLKPIE